MKRIFTILILTIITLSLTSPLYADENKNKFAFSIGQSISSPMGDFSGTGQNEGLAKAGFGYSGSIEYLISKHFIVGGVVSHHPFKTETGERKSGFESQLTDMATQYQIADPSLRINIADENKITTFGLYLKYQFPVGTKSYPYVKIGAGAGKHKRNIDMLGYVETLPGVSFNFPRIHNTESIKSSGSLMYMEGGGGYLHKLTENFGLKGEILYTRLMTNDKDSDIVTLETTDNVGEPESITEKYNYNCDYFSAFISLNFFFGLPKSKK